MPHVWGIKAVLSPSFFERDNMSKVSVLRSAPKSAVALAVLSVVGSFSLPASAALDAAVTTAISTAGTDLLAGATAVIVAMVAYWGVKKLGTKMGWW